MFVADCTLLWLKEANSMLAQSTDAANEVASWFSRMDSIVVGPGLGQDPVNQDCAHKIMRLARDNELPMVIDADGLRIVTQDTSLLNGCFSSVITPNFNELHRLANSCGVPHNKQDFPNTAARVETALSLAKKLDGPVIVSKGPVDIITDGEVVVECTEESTPRRCGGQGDVLAGCMSVMISWAQRYSGHCMPATLPKIVAACYGACCVTRISACLTFKSMGRSMLCTDMMPHLVTGLSKLEI